MTVTAVLGAQWGDEGKGKLVDVLARDGDIVARFSGGNNAGHTVITEQGEFKFHLLPSGVVWPHTLNVIGNGVVVDPDVLLDEITGLEARGISIAGTAHRQRAVPPRDAVSRHARPDFRAGEGTQRHRDDGSRHRPRLRRQGLPNRHPGNRAARHRSPPAAGSRTSSAITTRS